MQLVPVIKDVEPRHAHPTLLCERMNEWIMEGPFQDKVLDSALTRNVDQNHPRGKRRLTMQRCSYVRERCHVMPHGQSKLHEETFASDVKASNSLADMKTDQFTLAEKLRKSIKMGLKRSTDHRPPGTMHEHETIDSQLFS